MVVVKVSWPRRNPLWRAHTFNKSKVSWKEDVGVTLDPVAVSVANVEDMRCVVDTR